MSRPAASAETDDILSSLRRLMAERPAPPATPRFSEPAATVPEPDGDPPETERLVLTEALRIHPPQDDTGNADADSAELDSAELDSAELDSAELDSADAGGHTPAETGEDTAARRLHLDSVLELQLGAEESFGADGQDEGISVDAFAAEDDMQTAGHAQPVSAEETTEDQDDSRAESDDISAITTEEAEQMTQAQAWKAPEQEAREPEDILLAEAAEERILDEETLREIVTQTVREELMGELGERITRNVKKLVRREIQRALAERAFD